MALSTRFALFLAGLAFAVTGVLTAIDAAGTGGEQALVIVSLAFSVGGLAVMTVANFRSR
tara:strand:- start:283 stop:462 length:180 start_codon:yes stop_codon:yes gene_type:complete